MTSFFSLLLRMSLGLPRTDWLRGPHITHNVRPNHDRSTQLFYEHSMVLSRRPSDLLVRSCQVPYDDRAVDAQPIGAIRPRTVV